MQGQQQYQYQPPSSPSMYPVHQHQQQQGYGSGYPQQGQSGLLQQPYSALPQQQGQYHHHPQGGNMYGSSQPSLPRYASQASSINGGSSGGGAPSPSLSPLNPSARSNGGGGYGQMQQQQQQARYSNYSYGNGGPGAQGGAHPLSHALYAESPSSPTLAGSDEADEKKHPSSQAGHHGQAAFPPPSSSSSSGDSRARHPAARGTAAASGLVGGAYKRWSGNALADDGRDERHRKVEHIGWIDGLRFFVAWAALNGTFFDATIPNSTTYSAIQRSSPLYIFRSFGLALSFFLVILGRALAAPLWDVPAGSSSSAAAPGRDGPSISFPRLTRAMLTRTFRFILPVLVVAALQWGLGASNATKDCNAAGMQQPYWNLINSAAGYFTVVFDSFYAFEYQTAMGQTFAGNLWTNAWFFDASFGVFLVHMMLGNLSSARYWVYALLGFFMWTTNNYLCLALIGQVIADLAAHGVFARVRRWPFMRVLALQIVLVAVALALQFINVVRNGLNDGMATINVTGHTELAFADLVFATCFMLVFETSRPLQLVLGNVVVRVLGRLAPGMYLLAPAVVFTVVPTLGVSLHNSGTSGSGILGVTWIVAFAIVVVAAAAFHLLVELPSKLAGEYFADFVEAWGSTAGDAAQVKAPQKSAPKKIAGPGGK